MNKCTIENVRHDWTFLHSDDFVASEDVEIVSHDQFADCDEFPVKQIVPNKIAKLLSFNRWLYNAFYALMLLRNTRRQSVLIINGGSCLWQLTGALNRILFWGTRRILCWELHAESQGFLSRTLSRFAIKGITLTALWSRKQISLHADSLRTPPEKFIFIPYKANHSKSRKLDFPTSDFIFAGGNSKRDYATLLEAVKGTEVTVVLSVTQSFSHELLPNTVVLSAREPAFSQLQAMSRFVVLPIISEGIRGAGEANICNAMWHGKAIIAADNFSASEYILEGNTGFVVNSGDVSTLRSRILQLWNDPEACEKMGASGRMHTIENFTHSLFIQRLTRLAHLVGTPSSKSTLQDSSMGKN